MFEFKRLPGLVLKTMCNH